MRFMYIYFCQEVEINSCVFLFVFLFLVGYILGNIYSYLVYLGDGSFYYSFYIFGIICF